MSTCVRICRDLPLFIGGDLDAARAGEIGAHLRGCSCCRREAVGLQQPLKHLRGITEPVVDEAMFASMHAAIVARLDEVEVAEPAPFPGWRVWAAGAAAAALFVLGWCWVERPVAPAALARPPIAVPIGHSHASPVVPYAGERMPVPLRLLGDEEIDDRGGAGLMWRWRLRSLVDGDLGSPPPIDAAPAAPETVPHAVPK